MSRRLLARSLVLLLALVAGLWLVEAAVRAWPGLLLRGAVRSPRTLEALERERDEQLEAQLGRANPYGALDVARIFRIGVPGAGYVNYGLDHTAAIAYNSLGLRAREPAELGGRPVALLLGDSMIEARQQPEDLTPSAQLERVLEEAGTPWWVVNAGIGATGTANQLHLLRYVGPHYRPQLVILVLFTGNDLQNNSLPLQSLHRALGLNLARKQSTGDPEAERKRSRLFVTTRNFYRWSPEGGALYVPRGVPLRKVMPEPEMARFREVFEAETAALTRCVGERTAWDTPPLRALARLLPESVSLLEWTLGAAPAVRCRGDLLGVPNELLFESAAVRDAFPAWWDETWAVTGYLLAELRDASRALGAELVVAVLPSQLEFDAAARARALAGAEFTAVATPPSIRVAAILDGLGIRRIELGEAFASQPRPAELFLPLDRHLNAAGTRFLAERIHASVWPGGGRN